MPVTPYSKVAFRCKSCGRLHTCDDASEAAHPHACRVCGCGISFDPKTGAKKIDSSNWEVLADATPERLAELGLSAEHVEKHTPWKGKRVPAGTEGQHVRIEAADGAGTSDRAG